MQAPLRVPVSAAVFAAFSLALPARSHALTIDISAGAGLLAQPQALAAWERAASRWEAIFTDPITVTIAADLADLGDGILGGTSSVFLKADYDVIRDAMVADAADELGDAIVASLPTAVEFSAFVPPGFFLDDLAGTKASLKALGFAGLDGAFGATDATISFSTDFLSEFDFDSSDGVGAGLFDFETIASHEMGHALGFDSSLDVTDQLVNFGFCDLFLPIAICPITPYSLDLFRFAEDPSTPMEFRDFPRMLTPGLPSYFDDGTSRWSFSTGAFTGDGNQASHWKDDSITGLNLGLMDPTLGTGVSFAITAADIRALDVIGWDFEAEVEPIPEPGTLVLLGAGLFGLRLARRRDRKRAADR
jgi:hypothetical protein